MNVHIESGGQKVRFALSLQVFSQDFLYWLHLEGIGADFKPYSTDFFGRSDTRIGSEGNLEIDRLDRATPSKIVLYKLGRNGNYLRVQRHLVCRTSRVREGIYSPVPDLVLYPSFSYDQRDYKLPFETIVSAADVVRYVSYDKWLPDLISL